jgi:hypothetical protein
VIVKHDVLLHEQASYLGMNFISGSNRSGGSGNNSGFEFPAQMGYYLWAMGYSAGNRRYSGHAIWDLRQQLQTPGFGWSVFQTDAPGLTFVALTATYLANIRCGDEHYCFQSAPEKRKSPVKASLQEGKIRPLSRLAD